MPRIQDLLDQLLDEYDESDYSDYYYDDYEDIDVLDRFFERLLRNHMDEDDGVDYEYDYSDWEGKQENFDQEKKDGFVEIEVSNSDFEDMDDEQDGFVDDAIEAAKNVADKVADQVGQTWTTVSDKVQGMVKAVTVQDQCDGN